MSVVITCKKSLAGKFGYFVFGQPAKSWDVFSSQAPMVHAHGGAYAEQFPDSSDVCGLFNISNFEGLDDTEPESRIAPGIVTRTFCVFEIKNALDSASKNARKVSSNTPPRRPSVKSRKDQSAKSR